MLNDTERQEQIRKRLVESIKQSGLTQTAIAKQAGLSVSMLTDYKNRGKMPSVVTLAKLCEVLDISADEILGHKK